MSCDQSEKIEKRRRESDRGVLETRSWVVPPRARRLFARVSWPSTDCRSQSALSARTALSAARRRFRPRVRSARAARTAKALGVPRRASDRTPQLRREPRAGSSRRDDASKMSTNSFHASAGARLESSTPRSDNPFTSGEEEVRRDGDVRSRRNARDSDGTGPAIGTRARRRVRAKRYAQKRAEEGIDANFYFGGVDVSESAVSRAATRRRFTPLTHPSPVPNQKPVQTLSNAAPPPRGRPSGEPHALDAGSAPGG